MLSQNVLNDALEMAGAVFGRTISEPLKNTYYDLLDDLSDDQIIGAFRVLINESKFPVPDRIREVATGVSKYDDWLKIVAVSGGSRKRDIISGISAAILIKITSSNGIREALRKVGSCSSFDLDTYRKAWESKIPTFKPDGKSLPPESVEICLEPPKSEQDIDYPKDWDFSFRKSALKKQLTTIDPQLGRAMKPELVMALIKAWPRDHKQEMIDFIQNLHGEIPKDTGEFTAIGNTYRQLEYAVGKQLSAR